MFLLHANHTCENMTPTGPSTVQVRADGALQLGGALAQHVRQVLEVVGRGDAEAAHKVARRRLEVAVTTGAPRSVLGPVVLGPAEVGVARDGRGALESLQARLGLGLRARVEGAPAEELVRGDALLRAELLARVLLALVVCGARGLGSAWDCWRMERECAHLV